MSDNALDRVIQVRRSIGDPVAADFSVVDELPEDALQNVAHTTGDGNYSYWDGVEWRKYNLKLGDSIIRFAINKHGILGAAIKLVNNLIARIDPTDYITSANQGGQSTSFPSLQEMIDYYEFLRKTLIEEQAAEQGMNSGLMLKTKKRPVGGVLESDE